MPEVHKCEPHDHLTKIAVGAKNKIGRKKIWDANKDRLKRKNPNILFTKAGDGVSGPFDTINIPDPKEQDGGAQSDKETVFETASKDLFIRLRILKDDFTPVADGTDYALDIQDADGNSWKEITDAGWKPEKVKHPPIKDGLIEVEVPPTADKGELIVRVKAAETDKPKSEDKDAKPADKDENKANRGDVPVKWKLKIGALNPILENAPTKRCISGVQQRLNNLGFNSGPVDGIRGPITKGAVEAFQKLFKLKVDTIPGPETQGKLDEVHDTKEKVVIPKE